MKPIILHIMLLSALTCSSVALAGNDVAQPAPASTMSEQSPPGDESQDEDPLSSFAPLFIAPIGIAVLACSTGVAAGSIGAAVAVSGSYDLVDEHPLRDNLLILGVSSIVVGTGFVGAVITGLLAGGISLIITKNTKRSLMTFLGGLAGMSYGATGLLYFAINLVTLYLTLKYPLAGGGFPYHYVMLGMALFMMGTAPVLSGAGAAGANFLSYTFDE